MSTRHFLTLLDLTPAELQGVIERAVELKQIRNNGEIYEPLKNRVLAMIFEKASTRTRVSFETGHGPVRRPCHVPVTTRHPAGPWRTD